MHKKPVAKAVRSLAVKPMRIDADAELLGVVVLVLQVTGVDGAAIFHDSSS
ncbi:MAG: hypothetical protein M3P30_06575 [Chloroflexota bacterium]|nr:hypothetical protein [Chloroflexota bacterium]